MTGSVLGVIAGPKSSTRQPGFNWAAEPDILKLISRGALGGGRGDTEGAGRGGGLLPSAVCFSSSWPLCFLYCYSSLLIFPLSIKRGLRTSVRAASVR